jgi:hypothetical protein
LGVYGEEGVMSRPLPRHELQASDDLRRRWLAWIGHGSISAACRGLGLRDAPKWASEGNIPEHWRCRVERQMALAPDLGTLLAEWHVAGGVA